MLKVYVQQNKRKQWWFKFVSGNGKTLCSSETYFNKKDCLKSVKKILIDGWNATVIER